MPEIIQVNAIRRTFGERIALNDVSFSVDRGEIFGLLGPNGGGKTTLFRILTTLLPPTSGQASICGNNVVLSQADARRHIGVVFQSPSLDIHLTARENLRHSGNLYGLSGADLEARIESRMASVGMRERADDRVKTLSGGMRRRVEIAKGMLHEPDVLVMDEPSSGLDPAARRELWRQLELLRESSGLTILLTTHFMDEADRCDRVAILDEGNLVAQGAPSGLKSRIGGDCITIHCDDARALAAAINQSQICTATPVEGTVRIETNAGAELVSRLMTTFSDRIHAITLGKPTLEDVFLRETGRRFIAASSGSRGAA